MAFLRASLATTASIIAIVAPVAALAQQQTSASIDAGAETDAAEEIVVVGQRAANKLANTTRQEATNIVDVISADDVGTLTDFNAGEALRRVAGVNTWSYLGEPRFVTIRGFNTSYNTTTVDGFQMASPDNSNYGGGRQFYMDVLPSNIASKIKVYKTWSPDMEGHSVGGSIEFMVPDALDEPSRINFAVRGGINVTPERYGGNGSTYQGEASITRTFGPDRQFGISLAGSYWRRQMNIGQYENGFDAYTFGPATNSGGFRVVLNPYDGQFGPLPADRTLFNFDNDRYRTSLFGKLSWEPEEGTRLGLNAFYLEQGETFQRHESRLDPAQNGSNFDGRNFSDGGGEVDVTANLVQLLQAGFTRKIYGSNLSFNRRFSDDWTVELKSGWSRATFDNPQLFNRFALPGANNEYYRIDPDGDFFMWRPVGEAFAAKVANYNLYSTSNGGGQSGAAGGRNLDEVFSTEATLFEAMGRAGFNMERNDRGFGFELGSKFSVNARSDGYVRTDYGSSTAGLRLDQVLTGKFLCAPGCVDPGIPIIDGKRVRELMLQLPGVPNAGAIGNRFTTTEEIAAIYSMGRYRGEWLEIAAGLRLELTDYWTTGFQQTTGAGAASGFAPVSARDNYVNAMPSFMAIYDISPDMRGRFAYSRTIGRPSLTQKSLRGGVLNLAASPPSLSSGNPDLEPRISDNLDLIFENYFGEGQGLFTIGGFYKRVQNEIYRFQSLTQIDGEDILATRPVNSPFAATVIGAEFNFVSNFTFLPGKWSNFGIQTNGVILHTRFPILLRGGEKVTFDSMPDQARYAANVSFYYEEPRGLRARIAWNRVGLAWDGRIGGNTNLPGVDNGTTASLYRAQFNTPRDSLDMQASYPIGPVKVAISAINLLNQGADTNIGNNQEIPAKRLFVPATFMLSLSGSF